MKHGSFGFSFLDIIMSVALLMILAAIGITYSESSKDKTYNSKIITEIQGLQNSFEVFTHDTKTPIIPSGNKIFFTSDTSYTHDQENAFGVSGFVTDTTLPKQYINFLPRDPRTNQFYALSSVLDTKEFEIAGIIRNHQNFQSRVTGNYVGYDGPHNLVREYNGPHFIQDKSFQHFPYNPYQNVLTATIQNFDGDILINDVSYEAEILTQLELFEGDTIDVSAGGYVELYTSDGSVSFVGDEESPTQITLEEMRFTQDTNLFTSIKIAMNMGSVWARASKLSTQSKFEVKTFDGVAAVRGTIFGVKKDPTTTYTNVFVLQGEVEVFSSDTSVPSVTLTQDTQTLLTSSSVGEPIEFRDGIPDFVGTQGTLLTGTINSNITPKLIGFESNTITIQLTPILRTAQFIQINGDKKDLPSDSLSGENLTYTLHTTTPPPFTIALCDTKHCTSDIRIQNQISMTQEKDQEYTLIGTITKDNNNNNNYTSGDLTIDENNNFISNPQISAGDKIEIELIPNGTLLNDTRLIYLYFNNEKYDIYYGNVDDGILLRENWSKGYKSIIPNPITYNNNNSITLIIPDGININSLKIEEILLISEIKIFKKNN